MTAHPPPEDLPKAPTWMRTALHRFPEGRLEVRPDTPSDDGREPYYLMVVLAHRAADAVTPEYWLTAAEASWWAADVSLLLAEGRPVWVTEDDGTHLTLPASEVVGTEIRPLRDAPEPETASGGAAAVRQMREGMDAAHGEPRED